MSKVADSMINEINSTFLLKIRQIHIKKVQTIHKRSLKTTIIRDEIK